MYSDGNPFEFSGEQTKHFKIQYLSHLIISPNLKLNDQAVTRG